MLCLKDSLFFVSCDADQSCQASHPVWDVDVGPGVQQVLDDLGVALLGGDRQCRVPIFVSHVDVGVPLQQLLHHLGIAALHRHDQSRHGVLHRDVRVTTLSASDWITVL